MKLFVQASLAAVLAASSIAAPTVAMPAAATTAVAPVAPPSFYRETIFFDIITGLEVGWRRYYCDGTVRNFGTETGAYEDFILYQCP